MEITYFILAEALAEDAGGVFSAIRIGQNITLAENLPANTKRAVFLGLGDSSGDMVAGDAVNVELRIVAPSGATIAATAIHASLAEKRFSDLPGELLIPAEFGLHLTEFGTYRISATVTDARGGVAEASVLLHALPSV